jgi:hypothetical protein
VTLQASLGVEGVGAVGPSALLHGIGAGVTGGVGVGRVVDCDAADDIFSLLGYSAGKGKGEVRTVRGLRCHTKPAFRRTHSVGRGEGKGRAYHCFWKLVY